MSYKKLDLSRSGLLNLLVVYLVWSSTYLAIRVAVSGPHSFDVIAAGYLRMFGAGIILLVFCRLRGMRLRIPKNEILPIIISGSLLWLGGNGLIMWAEKTANSGFAALMAASTPLLVAGMESLLDKKWPSILLTISLVVSFTGIGVLVSPAWQTGGSVDLISALALFGGALSWGAGSLYQSRQRLTTPAPMVSACQHLSAGVVYLAVAFFSGSVMPSAGTTEWLALGYLILFGSVWSFTAFLKALQLLPIHITMTYGFVNPVLALFLGWLLLHEAVGFSTLVGALLVVAGVVGVFLTRLRTAYATVPSR